MVQILKDTVRDRITEAALTRFAMDGFADATMGDIAGEAGVATGTIYKYFKDKNTLFDSIVSDGFVSEYRRLTQNRIASFARSEGTGSVSLGKNGDPGELLRFLVRNRRQAIILLSRAGGTRFESFAKEYVEEMESQTLCQARKQFPGLKETTIFLFMAHRLFENSIRDTVAILEKFQKENEMARAFRAMAACQVAALLALAGWTEQKGDR